MKIPRTKPHGAHTKPADGLGVRFGGVPGWSRWLSCLGSGFVLVLLAGPAQGGGGAGEVPYIESQAEVASGRRLRPVLRRLESVDEDSFLAVAEELLLESTDLALDGLLLQAGRPLPPGLTSARLHQRRAVQAAAQALIAADLQGSSERGHRWRQRIELHLGTGAGASSADLRAAAMLVAARLELVYLAPRILGFASPEPRGIVQVSAQEALRLLYGRWLQGDQALRGLVPLTDPGQAEMRLAFQAVTDQNRELWLRLLESDPGVAAELFQGPDPGLRAQAARRLLSAIGKQELPRAEVADLLLARVQVEPEAGALHAALATLVEMAQAAGPEAGVTGALRGVLRERASTVSGYLAPVLLSGLERLPAVSDAGQSSEAEGDTKLACELLGNLLVRGAPVDGDNLLQAIDAWSLLVERAAGQCDAAQVIKTKALVGDRLSDSDESVAVRMAAAKGLGRLQPGEERLATALDLLERKNLPSTLRVMIYSLAEEALLTGEQAPGVPGQGAATARLVSCLTSDTGAADSEVRRRVIRLLGSPPVVQAAHAGRLDELSSSLLNALVTEPLADLQTAMLYRLHALSVGRPSTEQLDRLLSGGAGVELRRAEEARVRALSSLLIELAGQDAAQRMRAARWMAAMPLQQPERPGELLSNDRSVAESLRLESALRVIVGLEPGGARALDRGDHREVLVWASGLMEGLGRVQLASTSAWLAEPLLEEHFSSLPRKEWGPGGTLLEARLLASRASTPAEQSAALSAFSEAIEAEGLDPRTRILLHRDGLRFLQRLTPLNGEPEALGAGVGPFRDRCVEVLASALKKQDSGQSGGDSDVTMEKLHDAADKLLDLTDFSRLAALADDPRLWGLLVLRYEWRNLPGELRLNHLLARSESALVAADGGDWDPLEEVVRTLEAERTESQIPLLWEGFESQAEDLERLTEDASKVLARWKQAPG